MLQHSQASSDRSARDEESRRTHACGSAESTSLNYVTDADPGIRRLRKGTGFTYIEAGGGIVDKATLARIKAIVIPPAWTDVWISPDPDGHIQATGRDQRGRKQYR
ncbi:DNA topoisomerase IB, partial [Mesorhizobium sp. VK3C]|nr:DNA topoisomerase IB [Mesorhizobium sp. VK3C]